MGPVQLVLQIVSYRRNSTMTIIRIMCSILSIPVAVVTDTPEMSRTVDPSPIMSWSVIIVVFTPASVFPLFVIPLNLRMFAVRQVECQNGI